MPLSYEYPIKTYCRNHRLFSNKETTHVFFDTGSLLVPDSKKAELLYCCAWNLNNNIDISLVELRTEVFNFFIDIDFVLEYELTDDIIKEITLNILDIINSTIEEIPDSFCIISKSEPYKFPESNKVKNGIHLSWNNLRVNSFLARKMRDIIVQGLYFNANNTDNTQWEHIIDEAVYITSGFRMMFMSKAKRCSNCNGNINTTTKRPYCENCVNTGFVYSRPYYPFYVFNNNTKTIDIKLTERFTNKKLTIDDFYYILNQTSIRCKDTDTLNVLIKEPTPTWYRPKLLSQKYTTPKSQRKYLFDSTLNEENTMSLGRKYEKIESSDFLFIHLQKFINFSWPEYKGVNITGLYRKEYRNNYNYSIRTNGHYCHNIRRAHKSNHIWFTIEAGTLVQRCFDEDCAKYLSNVIDSRKLTQKIINYIKKNKTEMSESLRDNKNSIDYILNNDSVI